MVQLDESKANCFQQRNGSKPIVLLDIDFRRDLFQNSTNTRVSNFWSSSGIWRRWSRDLCHIDHVIISSIGYVHANLLLVQFFFEINDRVTYLFANSLLVQSERCRWTESGFSMIHFRRFNPLLVHLYLYDWTKSEFSNSLNVDQKWGFAIIYFEEKLGWTKSELACTWLT